MAALANFVGLGSDRSASLFSLISERMSGALHRTARVRYAEQRGLIERTGLAGMI